MIDIKLIRENKEMVKENIKKKFQDEKLPLVDEVYDLDIKYRKTKTDADNLKNEKNKLSDSIGIFMREGKKDEAAKIKDEVKDYGEKIVKLEAEEDKLQADIKKIMMVIPNIIDPSVPIGKNDTENVELKRFGEPIVPKYEIPYHADIIEALNGMDKTSAGRTSGEGFYYLLGDIARLHEAMLAYARDYMVNKGFIFAIPPFMIHGSVVEGVMSFPEMDAMMYKIDGEDLYLIGTSEHSMIGRFKDQIIKQEELPITMTSYSPCFRKEGGSHGLEERGLYRVHQFEKEEMIVICEPDQAKDWYEKMWNYTVEVFRNFNVPVRQLACCSGDLADLKVISCDVEAWSPRQHKYFEVGSCSDLGTAQARRLGIRIKGDKGNYYANTLNNTVVASPRGLIALIENNYNEDGTINIPKCLQPYMGGLEKIVKK
jgi:seryl-tRNA synthetase